MTNTNFAPGPETNIAGAPGGLDFTAIPSESETESRNDVLKAEFTNLAEDFFNSQDAPIFSGDMAGGRMDSVHIVAPSTTEDGTQRLRPYLLNRITAPDGIVNYHLIYDGDKSPIEPRRMDKWKERHVVSWGSDSKIKVEDIDYGWHSLPLDKTARIKRYMQPLREGMYYNPDDARIVHSPKTGDKLASPKMARLRTKAAIGYAAMAPKHDMY
jgi:hypothetical protein